VAAGLLGGVAPALEILPHRSHRHRDAILAADQVLNRTPGPQRTGDAKLLGAVVDDQVLEAPGLLVGESTASADRSSGAVTRQSVRSLLDGGRPPPGDGFPRDTEQVSDIGFGEAEFTPVNGTQAERFEDVIGQLTGVG
jgi:hypothetical protein